jgi:phosphatidylethanolamine-binding protein (PEBP) family uncharacterized protein
MSQVLVDNEVIADVAGLSEEATVPMHASFALGFPARGAQYKAAERGNVPTVSFAGEAGKKYTLIMTDPDAPDRSEHAFREFVHWVQCDLDFQGSDGRAVLSYCGPGPPCNSGYHRYVYMLYEQPEDADVDSLSGVFEGRGGKKAHLAAKAVGLGPLVAVDFVMCDWDESVDALHETLGFMPPDKYQR